jgi:hypothetical protein
MVALPTVAHASGSTYYVSTAGRDSNAGTSLSAPFLTIDHCAQVATAGSTCLIEGGIYHETVTPANSGTAGNPITFAPYDGQSVTVDGADAVTGWSLYSGDIYRASVTLPVAGETSDVDNSVTSGDLSANQVFVGGTAAPEAQYPAPSTDPSHPSTATEATGSSDGYVVDASLPDVELTGALEHVVSTTGWTATVNVVSSATSGSFDVTRYCGDPNCNGVGAKYYLTGGDDGLGLLTQAGEWWYDWTNHYLYLWAPGSVNPSTLSVEAKERNYAFDLSGRSYIDVTGLNVHAATVLTSPASSNNTLNGITATDVSHEMTTPDDPADTSCGIWCSNMSISGIILNGTNETLENSVVDGSSGDGVTVLGTGTTVTNNLIENTDYLAGYSSGVEIAYSGQGTVTHNTLFNSGRFLIDVTPGSGTYDADDTISHNNLYDFGIQTRDLGAIYSCCADVNGDGSEISYNWVHDSEVADRYSQGIMLDDGAGGYTLDRNVLWNTGDYGIKLNSSGSSTGASPDNLVYNNTIAPGMYDSEAGSVTTDDGTVLENNEWAQGSPIFQQTPPDATVDYNSSNTTPQDFVNPSVDDFHLQSASPAINAGTPISGVTNGYVGSAPDQGAYEYGGTDWIAGCDLAACQGTTTPYLGIQAASRAATHGTSLEPSSAGGRDVDFIYNGDWTEYQNVDLSQGAATLTVQVASPRTTPGTIEAYAGSPSGTPVATCTVPDTGNWQTYATVSCPVSGVSAGTQTVYLVYSNSAESYTLFNVGWFRFSTAPVTTIDPYQEYQATLYTSASGVGVEGSSGTFLSDVDTVENGDWTGYADVAFGSTSPTTFTAQVASNNNGGTLAVHLDSTTGTAAGSCTAPGTGGWQVYTTVSCSVSAITGTHTLYLVYTGSSGYLFNINWFKFS